MTHFTPFRFDADAGRLWRNGARVHLSPKAVTILKILVGRPNALISKGELLHLAWGDAGVQPAILKVYIRELRKALDDDAGHPRYIEALAGKGYRFIADIASDVSDGAGSPVVVARADELARLTAAFECARSGRRQIVCVAGPAGVGKTSLCGALLSGLTASSAIIARGQCIDASAAVEPYYGVIDALTNLSREGETARTAIATRAPNWQKRLTLACPDERCATLSRHGSAAVVLAEMKELVQVGSQSRPFILLIEDLQWADGATLALLREVARDPEPAALLIVGTFRTDSSLAPDGPAARGLAGLQRIPGATTITLTDLGRDDVHAYMQARFQRQSIADALTPVVYQTTSGHPAYLAAAMNEVVAEGLIRYRRGQWQLVVTPSCVGRSIQRALHVPVARRFGRLPPETRALLDSAAQMGLRFNARSAAVAAELDVSLAERECDRLIAQGILERERREQLPDGTFCSRYRFRRSLDRTALRKQILPAAEAVLKRRVASVLAT